MAITKLDHLKERKKGNPAAHLKNAIRYILNPEKTEGGLFVGGNCGTSAEEIYASMISTKEFFGKTGGRQGYHFVISFSPGEASCEEAFLIGKVEEIPEGASVLHFTEEELLCASFVREEPDLSEMDRVFSLVKALHAEAAEGMAFTSALVPKIRYMSQAEKEEMLAAIAEGMSYEDLLAMAELKAEDMMAFRLKKKVS